MFIRDEKFFVEYAKDKNGNYPLQIACKYGKYQIAAYLLHHYPVIRNNQLIEKNQKKKNPVRGAGSAIDTNIDHQNKKGYTAYHFAAEAGQLRILKLLDSKKAKFDALTY